MHKLMTWLKWILFVAILLFMLVLAVEFVASNTELISVSYLGYQAPQWSLAWYLLVSFIVGGVLGVSSAALVVSRLWMKNKSLHRKLVRRDAELKSLHESVIKGTD
ncbi:LapA family protein [Aestuariirhabdus sp. Z084]|uniref:LapA family protein n=1 Tax=Aestuariirhabdus haliotis TaxID=2918751 RepID=UPI00201B4224|nr:LapA family protein [Aestuariirhabdus haliotis]MCL6417010.1 LapA family protein [Aestuariirhabdus haliotis]MCL6421043.1 LapA family protein [Aestuariirhabdus haliotis]